MLPLLLLTSCRWLLAPDPLELDGPTQAPTRPASRDAVSGYAFARHAAEGTYDLPASNRPGGAAAPSRIPLVGPFAKAESLEGQQVWSTPLPVRSNLVSVASHGTHFVGTYAPPGMEVVGAQDAPLKFKRFGRTKKADAAWGFDRDLVYVGLVDGQKPEANAYTLLFPKATAAEDSLNFATAGLEPQDFAVRTLVVGDRSHTGLYLPAPASASWTVDVPAGARLGFRATVVSPAIRLVDAASDGAVVVVEVVAGGKTTEVLRQTLAVDDWVDLRAELAPYGGQTVEVRFRTEAGGDNIFDYVLLEAPALYIPAEAPRRVIVVFVDTLRPDHLGMYGYERPTTPNLDRWAEHAVRFEQARSVAPWTLPSARAMLTGRQPERYYEGPRLQERLADAGFRTDAFVTNAFLSQPFDMHLGWDHFDYHHLDPATEVVTQAVHALDSWPDRDSLLMIHLMEPHLPYQEDAYHRWMFAGRRPEAIKGLHRKFLSTVGTDDANFEAIRDHVIDRYDGNIRAVDDALVPLLEAAGPDATVVLVSDHGEEFWDHGAFEHGHTFYDELLHVPLVIRSPGLPPGVVSAPVSLLDLTPTLLEIVGLEVDDSAAGQSLVDVAWGEPGASDALSSRPQAFGRPLYGVDGWGVLVGQRKYWDRQGERHLHVLESDPLERMNLASPDADDSVYHNAMAEALDRPVRRAWLARVSIAEDDSTDHVVTFHHPEGIDEASLPYDPRGRLVHAHPEVFPDGVRVAYPEGAKEPEGILLFPTVGDTPIAGFSYRIDDQPPVTCPPARPGSPVLCVLGEGGHSLLVREAWAPVPDGVEVSGFHPDLESQLGELGYIDE